jgi:hypothetical protein
MILILSLLGFPVHAICCSECGIHIVKEKETLSDIAMLYYGRQVYDPKKGALVQILALNIRIKNPNLIYPGEAIIIRKMSPQEPSQEQLASLPPISSEEKLSFPISDLGIDLGFEYFRIVSTDKRTGATSYFVSEMNSQGRLSWELEWNSQWSSKLNLNFKKQEVQDTSDTSPRKISNNSGRYYWGFDAGAIRNWSNFLRTGLTIGQEPLIFVYASDDTNVILDHVYSTFIKLNGDIDLVQVSKAKMGLSLFGKYIFPTRGTGYYTESGYSSELSAYIRHERRKSHYFIQGSVYYGMTKQDSELVKQSNDYLGYLLGLTWRFD